MLGYIYLNLAIDRFKCDSACVLWLQFINTYYFSFCCFRAFAYTTSAKLWTVFSYIISNSDSDFSYDNRMQLVGSLSFEGSFTLDAVPRRDARCNATLTATHPVWMRRRAAPQRNAPQSIRKNVNRTYLSAVCTWHSMLYAGSGYCNSAQNTTCNGHHSNNL